MAEGYECGGGQVDVPTPLSAAKTVPNYNHDAATRTAHPDRVWFVFVSEARHCCVHDQLAALVRGAGILISLIAVRFLAE